MKNTTRSFSIKIFIIIILIGWILFLVNSFVGNPISKFLADRSAKEYIEETYPNMKFESNKASYSVKTGGYYVHIESPVSIDTHFEISISPTGDIYWDSYEENVLNKWNTYIRVDSDYREMVDSILDSDDFIYESDIDFGGLTLKDKNLKSDERFGPVYGLNTEELEIDKIYDIKELGRISGNIVLHIEDEEINAKRASEMLLNIKDIFDEKDVPFYTIDFLLEESRIEEGKAFEDRERFGVREFLYSDIYDEELIERLEKAAKDLEEYYKKQDANTDKIFDK